MIMMMMMMMMMIIIIITEKKHIIVVFLLHFLYNLYAYTLRAIDILLFAKIQVVPYMFVHLLKLTAW